jgi:type IV pilus assembly protein PilY1
MYRGNASMDAVSQALSQWPIRAPVEALAFAFAFAFALLALGAPFALAAPPVLDIASGPITAACRPATPAANAGTATGATLLRPTTMGVTGTSTPSGPAPSVSSGDLYQATVDIGNWGGHFERYILAAGSTGADVAPIKAWDAGLILTGGDGRPPTPAPEERKIHTSVVQARGALAMVPFAWPNLSPQQQALLNLEDGLGEKRLAYLRGDRSLEGTLFRRRGSVLGDAINSTPVFVGALSSTAAGAISRRAAIYLGANDGMLHAFDAINGEELFAYVPNALIGTLNRLSDPAYLHRAYVDGPASAGEVIIGGNKRTVLISAMGGGAQGVFALDVTEPARFAESGALWEFTDRDDPMMGNVTTIPQAIKVRTRVSAGQSVYRYFAMVAAGFNNYAGDGNASGAGQGALFLLALDKPRDTPWQLNVNYYRLITPISEPSLANALSAPVLLADADGALRYAYAGDLQGNLWRFDFSGGAPWLNAAGPGAGATPLFVARDASGQRQPITQQPLLAYAGVRGYMVMFGTGRLIETADRSSTNFSAQSYYAILDSLQTPPDLVSGRRQLAERVVDGATGNLLLRISGDKMDAADKGWYVDFLQAATTGERSINRGLLAGGEVLFNTILPGADACHASRSRSYVLNVLTGLPDDRSTVSGMPAEAAITALLLPDYAAVPVLLPTSTVRERNGPAGRIGVERNFAVVNVTGQARPVIAGNLKVTRRAGRLSWREVANWRELHEAAR